MIVDEVLTGLRAQANPDNVAGMSRYGISPVGTLGVPMPVLRRLAKRLGRDHDLALGLWETGVHEARILAALIDDPGLVTREQMERWVCDLDSWDVCDQLCSNLLDRTPCAYDVPAEWSVRDEPFVKRAAFVLMASLAVHDKAACDDAFSAFLPLIAREAADERHAVKKAVNWALRQIGKRDLTLNAAAIRTAEEIARLDSPAARWTAADALRELRSGPVRERLERRRSEKGDM